MFVPDHFWSDLLVIVVVGAVAVLGLCGAVKVWDLFTKKVDEQAELAKGNMAVAVVQCTYMACIAYILGQVIAHVLGG